MTDQSPGSARNSAAGAGRSSTPARRIVWRLLMVLALCALAAPPPIHVSVAANDAPARRVRSVPLVEHGVLYPAGLAFSASDDDLIVLENDPAGNDTTRTDITRIGDPGWSAPLDRRVSLPANSVFDPDTGRLFTYDAAAQSLVEARTALDGDAPPAACDLWHAGIQDPRGMSVDPGGRLFILDGAVPALIVVQWKEDGAPAATVPLPLRNPKGVAFNPTDGHVYVMAPDEQRLYKITVDGELVSAFDMSGMGLGDPQGLLFAPTVDPTDDPANHNIYILNGTAADGNQGATAPQSFPVFRGVAAIVESGTAASGSIVEVSLAPQVELAAAATTVAAPLVRVTDASLWSPPAPDTAGVTYVPGSDTLLITDSEVDEMPIYQGKNVFVTNRSGDLLDSWVVNPSLTKEPTDIAVNQRNGHIFISDDDWPRIFEFDLGGDGRLGTSDDMVRYFNPRNFNCIDPEGIAFDSANLVLYIADGLGQEIWRVAAGPNGQIDGGNDDQITHFDTGAFGIRDPEGVAFSAESGTLFVVSAGYPERLYAWEFSITGTLLRTIDTSVGNVRAPAGVAYAPSSSDARRRSLYIVDRGVDNNDVSYVENDGKLFEFDLGWGAPEAPASLIATAVTSTRIDLTWTDASTLEDRFRIERSGDGGGTFAEIATVPADVTRYSDLAVTSDHTYTYRVRASNTAGMSAYSNLASATTAGAPAAPADLIATVVSSTVIALTWTDNSSDESAFLIERSTAGGSGFTEIATVGANVTTYMDGTLVAGTTATYRVRASNGMGTSAYSNTASGTTPTPTPPAAPVSLIAAAASSTRIDLAWSDASDDEEGFSVERSTDGGATFAAIGGVGANVSAYSDTTVVSGTAYSYRVRASNAVGSSDWSNLASATTPAPPVAPSGLTATVVSSTQVNLAWSDTADTEDAFHIERSLNGAGFSEIATVGANVTSYSDSTLTAGTTASYRVRASNTVGSSDYSNVANATTPAPPASPSALTATVVSSTQVNLAWSDTADTEDAFHIERSTNGGGFSQIATVGANVTSYSDSTLTAGTTASYRVRASNTIGSSDYSNVANATTPAPPVAPSGLTATVVSSTQVNLAWSDTADNEDAFHIERSTDGFSFAETATVAANVTVYSDSTVVPGTAYSYRVHASNGVGASAFSNTATATTPAPPSAPIGLIASAVSTTQIDLAWTDTSAAETGFVIERSLDGMFLELATVGANVTSYSDTTLGPGITASYRVHAVNAIGPSGDSNVASATTLAVGNQVPIANGDAVTSTSGAPVTVTAATLLANDSDTDGDALTVTSVAAASSAGGAISADGSGAWTYTPAVGFAGTDTFTYTITDARGATAAGLVTVTVTPPPDGLVLAFGFDDSDPTVVTDLSSKGNNGVITGAVRVADGRFGGALRFNGVSDLVTVADSNSLDLKNGMTLEAWVRPENPDGWQSVILKQWTANASSGLAYGLYANTDGVGGGPAAYIRPSGWSSDQRAGVAARLAGDTWRHLAATYDRRTLRLYLDGVRVASIAVTTSLQTSSMPLFIGGNRPFGEFFAGLVDQVRIYDKPLTDAQVKANMVLPIRRLP